MKILPDITVAIPVFNQDKFIGRSIRSLLAQNINRNLYKILVIDDCSTDMTSYALSLFKEDIQIISNEKNIGLPASLNKALRLANTPYFVRLDSDDYLNEHFLYTLKLFLDQNTYMDAIACDYIEVSEEEDFLCRKNCLVDPIACGIMFRTKTLIEIGLYDETFFIHEDKELMKRFKAKYNLYRLELPLYRYRKHGNNLTNDKKASNHYMKKLVQKHGD